MVSKNWWRDCWNFFHANNINLSEQDCDSNNFDVSSGNGFIYSHTLSKFDDSIKFKEIDGDVEKGDLSSGYGSMNRHTFYQPNGLKPLMNYNGTDDM